MGAIWRWLTGRTTTTEPRATNAQVGYILSLMDELGVHTLEIEAEDPRTGKTTKIKKLGPREVPLLRKGDASQVITHLLKAKEQG